MSSIQWLELLRDSLWQFIGVLFGVLALLASVAIYFKQRQRKILQYRVVAANRLLSGREELEGRVQVTFDGRAVNDLSLLVFDLANVGEASIRTSDFERPIAFRLGKAANVLSAEVVEATPFGIGAALTVDGQSVGVAPMLLNPGDSVRVKVLMSDFEGTIEVESRIAGVSSIELAPETKPVELFYIVGGFLLTAVSMLISSGRAESVMPASASATHWISMACLIVGAFLVMRVLFIAPSSRKLLYGFQRDAARKN